MIKHKNLFELAILNGTGEFNGHASILWDYPDKEALIPKNKKIKRSFGELEIGYEFHPECVVCRTRNLPKNFLAIFTNEDASENLGFVGYPYGGMPEIFGHKPTRCTFEYVYSNESNSAWGFKIYFTLPRHDCATKSWGYLYVKRNLERLNAPLAERFKNKTPPWDVEIKIERKLVKDYLFNKMPLLQ